MINIEDRISLLWPIRVKAKLHYVYFQVNMYLIFHIHVGVEVENLPDLLNDERKPIERKQLNYVNHQTATSTKGIRFWIVHLSIPNG